nr:fruit bromelain [Malus domestica]
MSKYGCVYPDSEEKERRFTIFKSNVEYVEKFNRDGNNTYKLGLDEFADLSYEDFVQQHTGYINPTEKTSSADVSFRYESLGGPDVPLSIDWSMHGAVTTVKNQGPSGCCWACKNHKAS